MNAQTNILFNQNKDELQRHLREITEKETEKFLQAAQAFYDEERRSEDQCLVLINSMIKSLSSVIDAGDWDSSFFLKTTIKPLRKLLSEAEKMRGEISRVQGLEAIEEYQLQTGECKYYISLYQADGHDLSRWSMQLASIDKYTMGRPIYKNEEDVTRAIRRKLLQTSEGYAVIVMSESKVLGNEFADEKIDRFGFPLITFEQGDVKSTDVIEFVHGGQRYHYRNHLLIEKI